MGRLKSPHGSQTLLPMLWVQRITAREVGLGESCRQEAARAQDVAPAQLGTYTTYGGPRHPKCPATILYLFLKKHSGDQKLFSPETHWPKQSISDHSDQRSQKRCEDQQSGGRMEGAGIDCFLPGD